ncbi:MAG TPA: DUF4345 family protein [Pararhizobium sp.]|nr:DUF4345 family protein [Pararhizobium sp.]
MEFYLPTSTGEWLACASATVTILFGLTLLVAPYRALHILRLKIHPDHPQAIAQARATLAGFYLGVGITAILFAQPFLWLALGAGWGFTAFGRLISILVDRGFATHNGVLIVVELVLASLPLAYVFGYT